jgi:drug/metabolite transporter (DMT)-like permease
VLLGEAVPITTVAGGLLVVAGVVLVQTARQAGPPETR